MSLEPPAKFFVNSGLVSSPTDIYNLLRPLLKQTVSYRYFRGRQMVSHGTGWVERIVVDRPEVSTFFTPLSICLNIDSFEHLEFETRPDQLIVYTLVQGDERIVVEFAPVGRGGRRRARATASRLSRLGGLRPDGAQHARRRRWLRSRPEEAFRRAAERPLTAAGRTRDRLVAARAAEREVGDGMEAIASYFKFAERGTTLGTEVKAGVTTFMVMAYIIFLNGNIIAEPLGLGSGGRRRRARH